MGTDMYGWVEFYTGNPHEWDAVLCLDYWLPRDYTAFNALFGIGHTDTSPVAGARGIPDDATELARESADESGDHWSATWITWAELKPYATSRDWGDTTWNTLFAFLRDMAEKVVRNPDHIRLVISFG